jgi:transcriptional regulator with XRE-family HTH domain
MNDFGILLTGLRVDRNLNYSQLGKKAGYDRKSIRQWESGEIYPPTDETIRNLCQALDATKAESYELFESAHKFHKHLLNCRYPTRKILSKCKDPESPLPAHMLSKTLRGLKSQGH